MSILIERQTVYFDAEEHKVLRDGQRQVMLDAVVQKLQEEGEDLSYVNTAQPGEVGVFQRVGDPGVYVTVHEPWPEGLNPVEAYVPPVEEEVPVEEEPPTI